MLKVLLRSSKRLVEILGIALLSFPTLAGDESGMSSPRAGPLPSVLAKGLKAVYVISPLLVFVSWVAP